MSSAVEVCADVRTGFDHDGTPHQPDAEVRELVGDYGEAFEGAEALDVFGSATPTPSNWLHVETPVDAPPPVALYSDAQGRAPDLDALDGHCVSL